MISLNRRAQKRVFLPGVDGLESRALLSGASATMGQIMEANHHHPQSHGAPLVPQLSTAPMQTISTIPANGDLNPYGVAFVPPGFAKGGMLRPGDILVSNFNASSNLQGTGTTIVRIAPDGTQSVFFQGQSGIGLTTALGALRKGFVIVGSVPTTDGTSATVQQGSLLIINRFGNQVANLTSQAFLNGPWDLTVNDQGNTAQVFVSNVLSGTVTRLDLKVTNHGRGIAVTKATQIASGYTHRTDPLALVLGPTGLAFDAEHNLLYVASTADNEVFVVPNASTTRSDHGTGRLVVNDSVHLHGPLGLVLAPNGNLIIANGDGVNSDPAQPSEITEFTTKGQFVAQFSLQAQFDAPFGIALDASGKTLRFAAVNDDTNTVEVFQVHR